MNLLRCICAFGVGTLSTMTTCGNIINSNTKIDVSKKIDSTKVVNLNFDNYSSRIENNNSHNKRTFTNFKNGISNGSLYLNEDYIHIKNFNKLNKLSTSFLFNWGGDTGSFVPINIDKNIKLVCKDGYLGFNYGNQYLYLSSNKLEAKKTYFIAISVDKCDNFRSKLYINGIEQKLSINKDAKFNIKNDDNFTIGSKFNKIKDDTMLDDFMMFNDILDNDDIKYLYKYIQTPSLNVFSNKRYVSLDWRSYVKNFNNATIQKKKNDLFIQDRNFVNIKPFNNPIVNIFRNDKLIYTGCNSHFDDTTAKDNSIPTDVKNINIDNDKSIISFDKSEMPGTEYSYKLQLPNSEVTKGTSKIYINSGLKGYKYTIDKKEKSDLDDNVNLYKNEIDISKLPEGEYFLHIKAIGNNGKYSSTITKKFVCERTKSKISNVYTYFNDNDSINVNFKVNDNIGVDKIFIKANRCGNDDAFSSYNKYGGGFYKEVEIKNDNKKNESFSSIIKQNINIADIGGGSNYIHLELGVINKGKKITSLSKEVKIDTKAPNISFQSNKNMKNPKKEDYTKSNTLNVKVNDNFNSIKNITLKYGENILSSEEVHLNPKILLLKSDDEPINNILKKFKYNFDEKTIQEVSEKDLLDYDIIIFQDNRNSISNDIAIFLNSAYDKGARIITIDKNSEANIHPIKAYTEGKGDLKYSQYFNAQSYRDENNNDFDHLFETINNYSEHSNKNTFITEIPEDTRPLLYDELGKTSLGVNNSKYIDATYSQNKNSGKWIHYNIADVNDDLLRRTIDEALQGSKKIKEFNKEFHIDRNGTYSIIVEDFSGNKSERKFEVKNIDEINPIINISYPEEKDEEENAKKNYQEYKYYQYEDIQISMKDKESGEDKIQLPSGNFSKINNINYRVYKNYHDFTFKAFDKVGNGTPSTIFTRYIDNEAPVITVKADSEENIWINHDVQIEMSGIDNIESKVFLQYKINDGYWTKYNNPIKLTSDGVYNISFRGYDGANNISKVIKKVFKIDKNTPTNSEISIIK